MKQFAKLAIPISALFIIGCGSSGDSNTPSNETTTPSNETTTQSNDIELTLNGSTEVFDGDVYESRSNDAKISLVHHTNSDRRYVTLTEGNGVIIRAEEE